MRIAILLNSYHNAGPSNVMKYLITNLIEKGHEIYLITLLKKNSFDEIQHIKKKGIKVIELNYLEKKEAIIKAPKMIHQLIMLHSIEIIHSNSLVTDFISVISKSKAKQVCTLHNNMFYNYCDHYGKMASVFLIRFHLTILKKMDKCVCCSEYIYNDMQKYLNNAIVIRNGVEVNSLKLINRENIGVPKDAYIYIYAGVLNSRKNTLWLASAFSKVRNYNEYLLILGEGEDKNKIMQIGDENIKAIGFVDNLSDYLSSSHVYISASFSEGFSLSVLEALSLGNYLLLSNIPSHKEVMNLCRKTYVGECFNNGDSDSFCEALSNLRKKIRQANKHEMKNQVQELFSAKTMMKKYEKAYLNILQKSNL